LSDDEARSLGFGANSTLKLDRTAAVKTGTTTNFHDNWTIGYTPDLLVGVWVGNSNHEAMHDVTGLTGAAPIWHETMRALLQGQPDKSFQRPDGLTQVEVCGLSGLLPTPACAQTRQEWFFPGTEPTSPDTFYRQLWIDPRTGLAADDSVPADQLESKIVLDLPAAAIPWARARGLPLLVDYAFDANPDAADAAALVLLSPHPNETYRFDPQFDQSAQQLLVEAAAGAGILQVSLWADGRPLETLSGGTYQAWWKLSVGEHRFWAQGVDLSGETVKSNVVTIQVVTD
jgi:membrane carboxypeptidase/penicillin-binding protein PbpC